MVKTAQKLKKKKIDTKSYSELARLTIGPWSQYVITFLIVMMMVFAMSIYVILLRLQTKSLIEDFSGKIFDKDKLVLLAIIAPVFLLCVPRVFAT
ncbi:hypothetical protein MHBO_001051 [Bonamia ostreae]|uniref:Amino acid transporter transmembrane domain-containing protein n=1 Tax=Bonamia ostreae TaxID=126728 RepID=A0ABV2AHL4_9EUKA